MRLSWLLLLGLGGCWSPHVKNFGFACSPTDRNGCPVGFQCLNGYCDDGSGGANPGTSGNHAVDMSLASAAADMAQSTAPADLAQASQPDLSRPVADMSKPATPPDLLTCKPDGATCA